jgi:DNA-binding MarR family transcriptional regulator
MAVLPDHEPEDLTDCEAAAWVGFLRTHASLVRELDGTLVAAHGLPLSSFEVLIRLSRAPDGRQRMSELAESVVLSRSGITRLIDRLERDGLVERSACASDARGSFAVITPAGRERLAEALGTHVRDLRERFLSRFSAAEHEQMAAFWARVDA